MKRHYGRFKERGQLSSLLSGIIAAIAAFLIISLIMTAIAYSGSDPTKKIGIYSLISLALTGFVSGAVTSKLKGSGGILCALISGILITLIILTVRLIIGSLSGSFALSSLSYLGACMLGAYLLRPRARRHRH